LLEASYRDRDGGLQVCLLDGLDQESQDVILLRAEDQLVVVVGRDEDHGDRRVLVDLPGRVDAVHLGHLDVRDDEVGLRLPAFLDELPSVASDGHDRVAEAGQDFLEIFAHVDLIISDRDP
jgi:hypothetical protein